MALSFIAIDFETANYNRYSACQIGLVCFVDGKEVDSLTALIQPPERYFVPSFTMEIHGICWEDVAAEPLFPVVWKEKIDPFLQKYPNLPLVAHNAMFDMDVIRKCFEYYQMDLPSIEYFDSLDIARRVWPEWRSHCLTDLGRRFEIEYKAHDALEDSRTCGLVVLEASKKMAVTDVEDLLKTIGSRRKRIMV